MNWRQKLNGGMLVTIGFILSPLSWWNDLIVNIPLALVFAWIISAFYQPAFETSLIVGYWLTNLAGFVLMHKGTQKLLATKSRTYTRRQFYKDALVSVFYTALIVVLVKLKIFTPLEAYFAND